MKIRLNGKFSKRFVFKIIPALIRNMVYKGFNQAKAFKIDKYIKEHLHLNITTKQCIYAAVSNIVIYNNPDGTYSVEVNPSINIPGYSIKLVSILKFIEYGNAEIKGYHILSKLFNYIEKNQYTLYKALCLIRR